MPTAAVINGYRFHFYASDRLEPIHIHVSWGDGYGKIWLDPVEVQYFFGFKSQEQREILSLVDDNLEFFKMKWYEFFGKQV